MLMLLSVSQKMNEKVLLFCFLGHMLGVDFAFIYQHNCKSSSTSPVCGSYHHGYVGLGNTAKEYIDMKYFILMLLMIF